MPKCVPLIQADEAKFRRFRFWSDWSDLCVFQSGFTSYLLQMRVNRFNRKDFLVTKLGNPFSTVSVELAHLPDQQRQKDNDNE